MLFIPRVVFSGNSLSTKVAAKRMHLTSMMHSQKTEIVCKKVKRIRYVVLIHQVEQNRKEFNFLAKTRE